MKKLRLNKFRKKSSSEGAASRITNETVAEHRERIIAGGRRFKYPIQYARHKLVINTVVITLASLVVLLLLGWWQLYLAQNSGGFLYRLTQIFPVPVASVDGEPVRFSDYLVKYRGSKYYLSKYDEIKIDSPDGKLQLDRIKRQSLDGAIADAYAGKLAREQKITVTDKDVDEVIDLQRSTVNGRISQETYDASSAAVYDWTPGDYRLMLKKRLLRSRVAFAVDDKANKLQQAAATAIKQTDGDFVKAVTIIDPKSLMHAQSGDSGLISSAGSTYLGLKLKDIISLQKSTVSSSLKSDDGYYFVKVIEKTDSQIRFTYLHIPLTELDSRIEKLNTDGKVHEYISVPKTNVRS